MHSLITTMPTTCSTNCLGEQKQVQNPRPMEPTSKSSRSNFISVYSHLPNLLESSDRGDETHKPLSLWPGMYHSPVTIALWETRSKIFEIMMDPSIDPPPQTRLLTRAPSESRVTVLYNFSSDFILREQYRDPWNEMRIGKLLEDLDSLAGTISVQVSTKTWLELHLLIFLLFPFHFGIFSFSCSFDLPGISWRYILFKLFLNNPSGVLVHPLLLLFNGCFMCTCF